MEWEREEQDRSCMESVENVSDLLISRVNLIPHIHTD
jgi:hypothetical protein